MKTRPSNVNLTSLFLTVLSLLLVSGCGAPAGGDWAARHGMSSATYQSEFDQFKERGYRLAHVSVHGVDGQSRYAAIWEKRPGGTRKARHGMTPAEYQKEFDARKAAGYRLMLVDGHRVGGQTLFAAIWEKKGGGALAARHGMTTSEYQEEFDDFKAQGYRLTHVSGYDGGGSARYAAIWEKQSGGDWEARHGLTTDQYQEAFDQFKAEGFRLMHVDGYAIGNTDYYAAIWEKESGHPRRARHRMTSDRYQCDFDNYKYQGYRLRRVSGYTRNGSSRYAAIWENTGGWTASDIAHIDATITGFMSTYDVPGSAVAIAKDGKLVFAKGYGFADESSGERACATHLFRVASVSKPVTSVAIMKLMEEGGLGLSDTVFGTGALLGDAYGTLPYSADEEAITIQQLLEHTAGGSTWNNKNSDGASAPMFSQPSMDHEQLIGWILDTRDPNGTPGTAYDYSNFGYCVLGRVIEEITGQTYESYVQDNILGPMGIKKMRIGGDTLADRYHWEVVYHDGGSGDPYGMEVRRMDAHGGWIASAIDLTRFMVRVDGFPTKADFLEDASVTTMTTPSAVNNGYAKGWRVNTSNHWWHSGSFAGARSILVRTSGGFCWAFLVNTRKDGSLDNTMWDVVNGVSTWPDIDLF